MQSLHYKHQYVRDLAWIIAAPPIIKPESAGNNSFLDEHFYSVEYESFKAILDELDKNPVELIEHIENGNTHLLGKYFESLVEFWLKKSKDKELLGVNIQVFSKRKTIGEFDFIYKELNSGSLIHLECAGKFYLAHKTGSNWDNFIGPNSADNLGRKLHKILNDQVTLSATEEGAETLQTEEIEGDVIPKILLKGYLFYYADLYYNNTFLIPESAYDSHSKGWWIYERDIDYFFSDSERKWIIVRRENWISNVLNPDSGQILTTDDLKSSLLEYFNTNTYPLLVAELKINEVGVMEEVNRGFVVSNKWPQNIVI